MGPFYVVFVALGIGFLLALVLGRPRGATEPALEGPERGAADHETIRELETSVDKKVEFLVRMGFTEIEYLEHSRGEGLDAFRVQNPMPLAGGVYLVHFLHRKRHGDVVASPVVLDFKSLVKHEEDCLKGMLITSGAFSQNAWAVLERAPVELVDGKQLWNLLKMFYPERFPRDRI